MSSPLSIRFDDEVVRRLRRRADVTPGATPSGLVQQLVDEGLRMAEFPGIVFRDGATGRRAALAAGPDVWEIVTALGEAEERGEPAITEVAELLVLPEASVRLALAYYGAFSEEIEAEVTEAARVSEEAEAAWRTSQRLLT